MFDDLDQLAALFEDAHERHKRRHDPPTPCNVVLDRNGLIKRQMFSRQAVAAGADPARGAPGEKLQRLIVPSAEQLNMGKLARQHMQLVDVAGGFLDGGKIRAAAYPLEERAPHYRPGAAGIVVEHDRQIDRAVHRKRVIDQFQLRRRGVIGRRHQDGVGALPARGQAEFNAVLGPDRPDTDDERDTAFNDLAGNPHQLHTFGRGLGVTLTGRAAHHDPMNRHRDQALNQRRKAVVIDGPVVLEWRDHRREDATKIHSVCLGI